MPIGQGPATTQPSPNQCCLGLCLGQRLHGMLYRTNNPDVRFLDIPIAWDVRYWCPPVVWKIESANCVPKLCPRLTPLI
jgi:hypothetical protein